MKEKKPDIIEVLVVNSNRKYDDKDRISVSDLEDLEKIASELTDDPEIKKELVKEAFDTASEWLWDSIYDETLELVTRYGGSIDKVGSYVNDYMARIDLPDDYIASQWSGFDSSLADDVIWEYYFDLFPDAKVPDGQSEEVFIEEQKELFNARESAYRSIRYLLRRVAEQIVHLRYGNTFTSDDVNWIFWKNDFKNFYPEFVAAFEEARTAMKERANEISREYSKLESRTKSIARRLLKITPELKIPDEVKEKIQNDSSEKAII